MEEKRASDIHLQVGSPPVFRIKGELVRQTEFPILKDEDIRRIVAGLLSEKEGKTLEQTGNVDLGRGFSGIGRFRINIFQQRGTMALVARRITQNIPDFESLNLPAAMTRMAEFLDGLVLITGPTGTGKSSTLAAIINRINHQRRCHILCIEDPIEFLYHNDQAIINQREVGIDVSSFQEALRSAVREDPDVILAGEIRDRETVEFALHGAETGHLVFGTLHSSNVVQTITRLLNFFPQDQQPQIRRAIAMHLKAVASQILLPSCRENVSVVPACEIMFNNPIIRRLIIEEQETKIIKAILAGRTEGMQDFETALLNLVNNNWITQEVALENAENPHSLEMKLKGIFLTEEGGIIT
ncbi:MAG: PilT/PilU family type 4a pilus ATPase [Candidatus Omnitrophica bacterium]|nr:PilT/PilU family type 4a pilus ATPase [Candidatus Omnitrophota bacterium]